MKSIRMDEEKRGFPQHLRKTPNGALSKKAKPFRVVGIGASAGGLDAFRRLLKKLPDDTGMTFVLVQHLDPTHQSSLTKIISASTVLPVIEAVNGMVLEPNRIYVMPSHADISLSGLKIRLTQRSEKVPHLPIDSFFQSLAERHGPDAIGIILSGTASDGTLGLVRIKSEGGITFAQDEGSAKFPGMPRSAANSGAADFILPPEKIAAQLVKIGAQRKKKGAPSKQTQSQAKEPDFSQIRHMLNKATGLDFTSYRSTMIERRIQRRMMLNNKETVSVYFEYLRQNKSEIDLLYKDIFIHVTNFFRNPERYDFLRSTVLPKIVANRPEEPWRIWVPGCSSGEEVYSLAITMLEFLSSRKVQRGLQIFASDISKSEIEKARTGTYPKDIEKYVPAKYLEKYFEKVEAGYKIKKSIRELCVFAEHDLTKDPPFSRMDLISCCNVLIYLEQPMQQKVLSMFHLSLKPSGVLMLGSSESTGAKSHLFGLLDKRYKTYMKRTTPTVRPLMRRPTRPNHASPDKEKEDGLLFDWQREADRVVLARSKHSGFLMDENMKILAFRGMITPFLEPVAGEASLELTKMVRKDLRFDLRALAQSAKKTMKPVRKENIPVRFDGIERSVTAEVIPIRDPDSKQSAFLLTLEASNSTPLPNQETQAQTGDHTVKDRSIAGLKNDLDRLKEETRGSIEQLERLNEELTSTNEELQSAMEELQSTNEEYESAKEQLESANEELVTLNEELQTRNDELDQVNTELTETRDYAVAIIQTVREPLVILDENLRISSANEAFYRVFELSAEHADQAYFFDVNDRQWDRPELRKAIAGVLKNETLLEDIEIEGEFRHLGSRVLHLNLKRVNQKNQNSSVLILVAIEDITARRRLEETSATVMNEIHHRVKNNLQVVASLLDLQSKKIQDEKAVEAFKDSRDRVRSMALIHEKIYQSAQVGEIQFKDYLREMMNHLMQLYAGNSRKIELVLEGEDIYLNLDQAVPCGLIANELLSNALKYAFPEERSGRIQIELSYKTLKNQSTGEFALTVMDNGVGFPAGFDPRIPKTMGMNIVGSLTRQLQGRIEVSHQNGATFRIIFPERSSS